MRTWLRLHRFAFALAWRKLFMQRGAALASLVAIGIALALPTGGYTLLAGLRPAVERASLDPRITVYLSESVPRGATLALRDRLRADPRISAVSLIAREDALRSLQSIDSAAQLLGAIGANSGGNPLPDVLVVTLRSADADVSGTLAEELRKDGNVGAVELEAAWARRLAALALAIEVLVLIVGGLLAIGLVAVIYGTIRLQLLAQREEIEISRLLGATDPYVCRPFYYFGMLQGSLGALLSLAVVAVSLYWLNRPVAEVAASYGGEFRFSFLGHADALGVVVLGGLLGWLAAYLSTSEELRKYP